LGVLIIVGVTLCIFWKRKKDRARFADGRFDPALARGEPITDMTVRKAMLLRWTQLRFATWGETFTKIFHLDIK
jgi:hypothetical protein